MRLRLFLAASACALLAAGCSKPSSGGIQVRVNFGSGLKSACVKVEARSGGLGEVLETGPMPLAGESSPLVVAVSPIGLIEPVDLQAIGYSDPGCTVRTAPAEVSAVQSANFADPVTVVELTLSATSGDGGVDQDEDGFPVPADCDDADPLVKPGAQELCTDRRDNDCDQAIDCADDACAALPCSAGGGASCQASTCGETSCGDVLDNDGDGAGDCSDQLDCTGQPCGSSGTCMSGVCRAPSEVGLCTDGLDNDADQSIDCLDSDCPTGARCEDGDGCTTQDACGVDGGCAPGGPLQCTMPPNAACYAASGTCQPGGVCDYQVTPGAACTDNRACTKADTCTADGGCDGRPACESPPSACFAALGTCNEADGGGCDYTPLPTGACSDGNACTLNDTCDGDGGCVGAPVTCTPPSDCQQHTGCDGAGACQFALTPGMACDAGAPGQPGVCTAAGACTLPVFPFIPSNFTDAQLPANAGALTFDCGTTVLATGAPGFGNLTWVGNCGSNPANVPFSEIQVGGQPAVLVFAESLTVTGGSSLVVTGGRLLILAVRTNATIAGVVDGSSTAARAGPGQGSNCGTAVGEAGGPGTEAAIETAGGGGGAGFGSAGGAGAIGGNAPSGAGGPALAGTESLTPLRGGCSGGNGGRASSGSGRGGRGGGAVQLTVAGTLHITPSGRVVASGQGGEGGVETGGGGGGSTRVAGGGGGSGGGLLLEAGTLNLEGGGVVAANGGGGGEAAGLSAGANGADGQPNWFAAPGGDIGTCGGNGGAGAALASAAQAGVTATCPFGNSGGGGGGGEGRIILKASTNCSLSGIVSPAPRGNGLNGCPSP